MFSAGALPMRTSLFVAAAIAALLSFGPAGAMAEEMVSDYTMGGDACGGGKCRGGLHGKLHRKGCGGHFHKRKNMEGLDPSFNCGCQGSYNYPVPPQYTYHWPGTVYKQVLMTDYHSPWRFPP